MGQSFASSVGCDSGCCRSDKDGLTWSQQSASSHDAAGSHEDANTDVGEDASMSGLAGMRQPERENSANPQEAAKVVDPDVDKAHEDNSAPSKVNPTLSEDRAQAGGAASASVSKGSGETSGHQILEPTEELQGAQVSSDNDQADPAVIVERVSSQKNKRASGGSVAGEGAGRRSITDGISRPSVSGKAFPEKPTTSKLSKKTWEKMRELFQMMDAEGNALVTREGARSFFQCPFAHLSVDAMFNEVDADQSGAITAEEFIGFWIQVRTSGYSEDNILEEIDQITTGGPWVDFDDSRDTSTKVKLKFPRRPLFSKLSTKVWKQCEVLFRKMDGPDGNLVITPEKAEKHFQGAFAKISVDAMFSECDVNQHGAIRPQEFIDFWIQVRTSGYKENAILDELDSLIEGGAWVDWNDGRTT